MGEVLIPYGENASDTAVLLLGAAEELDGVEAFQVRNQPEDGGFRVPEEVAKKAGLKPVDEESDAADANEVRLADQQGDQQDGQADEEKKATPRKRAAKKTTAKKTASK